MQLEFLDSVKARLYDFKYSPFLSSFIFAWIYWNSKFILIFFSDKLSVYKKIELLSYDAINYKYPIYFALLYVFIFPIASAFFYSATLFYKLVMNWIQQKIQDKTPLPQETANAILKENNDLQKELNETMQEMTNIKTQYKLKTEELENSFETKISGRVQNEVIQKTTTLTSEKNKLEEKLKKSDTELIGKIDLTKEQQDNIKELNSQITILNETIKKVNTKNEKLEETIKGKIQFNENQAKIQNKEETINELNLKISNFKQELQEKNVLISKDKIKLDKKLEKYKEEFSEEEILTLQVIYKNDIRNHNSLENYLQSIAKHLKMPLVKLETTVKSLSRKGLIILRANSLNHDLTDEGKLKVLEMFE